MWPSLRFHDLLGTSTSKTQGISEGQLHRPNGASGNCMTNKDIEHLRQPEDASSGSRGSFSRSKAIFSGWRAGISWCIVAAAAVFLANFAIIIWSIHGSKPESGNYILFQGSCESTRWIATVAHLVINALSTLLLGASNYCMQVLASPTREDIDRLHAQHITVRIGANSFGNVLKLGWPRGIMWCLLGISSMPIHLIFNSIIFSNTPFYTYDVAQTTEPLPVDASWDLSRIQPAKNLTEYPGWLVDAQQGRIQFTNQSGVDCIKTYYSTFVSSSGNLLLVTPNNWTSAAPGPDNSSTEFGNPGGLVTAFWSPYSFEGLMDPASEGPQKWLCPDHVNPCPPKASHDGTFYLDGTGLVKYCLSQEVNEKCSVEFSSEMAVVVSILVLTKIVCMLWILLKLRVRPLVVLGDAISSFVQRPDPHTSGACLGGPEIFRRDGLWIHISEWDPTPKKWGQNVSACMWLICGLLWSLVVFLTFVLFESGQGSSQTMSFKDIFNVPFGALDTHQTLKLDTGHGSTFSGLLPVVLLTNTPQLIISCMYFTYNSILTSMLAGMEWCEFAHARKMIRVSFPTGAQRSTYWLQIPLRYGIPLMVLFGCLHWITSQSLFLVLLRAYRFDGIEDESYRVTTCGYSLYAIFILIILISGAASGLFVCGKFRRYNGGMQLIKGNSAAISAACHSWLNDDENADALPLRWGAVPILDQQPGEFHVGHCCFSCEDVTVPKLGRLYA